MIKTLKPEDVEFIAVHCSATNPKMDIGVKEIDRWHRDRGFLKIGYHFVIRRNGAVEMGRTLNQVGAHIEGFNSSSIGVCLVGGVDATKQMKPENNYTPAQFKALRVLLKDLALKFPNALVQGHCDFPQVAKSCPCFSVRDWLKTGPQI